MLGSTFATHYFIVRTDNGYRLSFSAAEGTHTPSVTIGIKSMLLDKRIIGEFESDSQQPVHSHICQYIQC